MTHRFTTIQAPKLLLSLACAAFLSVSGCKKQEADTTAKQDDAAGAHADPVKENKATTQSKATLAAGIAQEISQNPDQADAILAKHGMNRDDLETLMIEVAKDPKLREAYSAARRNSLETR